MEQHAILNGLNDAQRAAVEQLSGPLLVLAGAGSGKTRVLTSRIAWSIARGAARPEEIFAVTFTNKAARAMRERAEQLAGRNFAHLWLKTFHSAAAAILREEHALLGLPRGYTIYDTDEQEALVRAVIRDEKLPYDTKLAGELARLIQRAKDRLLAPEDTDDLPGGAEKGLFAELYDLYNKRLRANGALDFGDLIMETVLLFQRHTDVCARYTERFRFILVDEFQDTNAAQYQLLRCLAIEHRNICVVGDDDQSIYSWRGAEARNFSTFMRDFQNPPVIRLEQNYRSSPEILRVASAVITNNAARMEKEIWSDLPSGNVPRVAAFAQDRGEAAWIAEEVRDLLDDYANANEIAILYRANWQSRILEEAFLRLRIPYRVIGGLRFYQRKVVRDFFAWLRLIVNPFDGAAFTRLVQNSTRGIGEKTIEKLMQASLQDGLDLVEVCLQAEQYLGAAASSQKKAAELKKIGQLLRAFDQTCNLAHQAAELAEASGFRASLLEEDPDQLENLEEFINALAAREKANPAFTLIDFVLEIALLDEAGQGEQEAGVLFMTIHNAKGLEFEHIFLTGAEEGVFPHHHSLEESADRLEEERRLFYVAVTRAKRFLTISYAEERRSYMGVSQHNISRFVTEIPAQLVHWERYGARPSDNRARSAHTRDAGFVSRAARDEPKFMEGNRVRHKEYGEGVVLSREQRAGLASIRVRFGNRVMTFIERYVSLEKIT
ncbi:MAG: UvrD-helicase domain-containing protein [Spirochaetota bacterium]|jgi:DNA helicase-2/ATP-dependent DNA helicase PcrA|nr:UvrD-helicase domain-containing protein [Spirochaetota bacterium]